MTDQPILLTPHPAHPSAGIDRISAAISRRDAGLQITYHLHADLAGIRVPASELGNRRDELWKHTSFELFLKHAQSDSYFEYNFSPAGHWAAYAFSRYREGGQDLACAPPSIEAEKTSDLLAVSVLLPELPDEISGNAIQVGISAVVEAMDGQRSYWALDHIAEAPDFHRSETFKHSLD